MQGKIDDRGPFPQYFNDDYDVIGVLGRGGMGYVYKAIHKALNREVALKVLDAAVGEEAAKRFYLEAQAMKKLDHQNIVQVYDFGKVDEQLFIAMTFVPGATLADILRDRRRLDSLEALRILRQVARGLLYAHTRGVVHRDIKPSNIIITSQDRVYLTDFGISQMQDLDRLTSTGMAMGTPEYMSPEQCRGMPVTLLSDVYSLGIVLYEMLTGDPPFAGGKAISVAWKQVYEEPPAPRTVQKDIPVGMEKLVLACLRKEPAQRPADMAELLQDFDKVEQEITGTVRRPTGPQPASSTQAHKHPSSLLSASRKSGCISFRVGIVFGIAGFLLASGIALLLWMGAGHSASTGFGFIPIDSVVAPFEPISVEGSAGPKDGYQPAALMDDNLQTAWIAPIHDHALPSVRVRLSQPTLVFTVAIANGYQKSLDDTYQDRYTYTSHAAEASIRVGGDIVRRVHIPDMRGLQYLDVQPFEASEFTFQIEALHPGASPNAPIAISEIKIIGLPFQEP